METVFSFGREGVDAFASGLAAQTLEALRRFRLVITRAETKQLDATTLVLVTLVVVPGSLHVVHARLHEAEEDGSSAEPQLANS